MKDRKNKRDGTKEWRIKKKESRKKEKEEDASLILRKKVERVTPNDPANIFRISSLNLTDCFSWMLFSGPKKNA